MSNVKKKTDSIKYKAEVWEVFTKTKNRFPKKIAIISNKQSITYQELYNKAEILARYIEVKKITKIALLFKQGIEMIIAMLASLKNKVTYIPFDPNLPSSYLIDLAIKSQSEHLLSDLYNQDLARLICQKTDIKSIIYDNEQISNYILDNSNVTVADNYLIKNSPAYILYTSGSTGIPKGVIQTQTNILKHINNYSNSLNITYKDRLTLFSTYAFDASVMDIYSAILNGATLYVIDIRNQDHQSIISFLFSNHVTVLHLVPTLFRYLAGFITKTSDLDNLRYIVLGGEALSIKDIKIFKQKFNKKTVLVNGYGPTECTVAFQYFINHDSVFVRNNIPIGKPLKGINFFLRNIDSKNKIGEIVIRSKGVAYGYFNNPDLTTKFFKIAHNTKINTFYTGDYGYIDENSDLIYVGRKDSQLKINGQKVYLSDIELFLQNHNEIAHSIALQIMRSNSVSIVVYIVCIEHSCLTSEQIKNLLKLNFPSYMQPSDIVILNKLPLTANGKVDRVLLRKTYKPKIRIKEYIPTNTTEKKLIQIFQDILKCPKINTSKSIIQMGGDSISMLKIIKQLQNTLGVSLSLSELDINQKIIDMIKYVQKKISNNQSYTNSEQENTLVKAGFYELSQAQLRYWYRMKNGLSSSVLNIVYYVQIEGFLEIETIYSAVRQTLLRHQAFKTYFVENKNIPYQGIQDSITFLPQLRNLQFLSLSQQHKELNAIRTTLLNYSFNFDKGNLFHIEFIKISNMKHVMLYVVHHLIFDGWSNIVFLDEIWKTYNAILCDKKITLPLLSEYQSYIYLEQSKIRNINNHKIQFWSNLINKIHFFSEDSENTDNSLTEEGAVYSFTIDTKLIKNIIKYSKENNITPFIVYLALFKFTIYFTNNKSHLLTTTDIIERDTQEYQNSIGLFTDILPIPIILMPKSSIQDNICNIHTIYKKCLQNKIPFNTLMNNLYPDEIKYYDKIFPNAFIFQNHLTNKEFTVNNLKIMCSEVLNLKMSRELIFEVVQLNSLIVNIYYKVSRYSLEDIKKMSTIYNELTKLFDNPASSLLSKALNKLKYV